MPTPELLQFNASHYNEKARWALDLKGIRHTRRTLLPGFHRRAVNKISGQPMVPVFIDDGDVIAGSAAIIAHLERKHPDPALYPADKAQRERALEIQRWFDDEIGVESRRAKFFDLLDDPGYVAKLFGARANPIVRTLYRAAIPVATGKIRQQYKIDQATAERARATVIKGLDFVRDEAGSDGYLVGDRFSVADLAAASLLALTVWLPATSMALPEPRAEVEERWLARWKDHAGTHWVTDMFRRHRGDSFEMAA